MKTRMRTCAIMSIGLCFQSIASNAQFFTNLRYSMEFGSAISVGPQTTKLYQSSINPWGVYYFGNEKYRYPSLRFLGIVSKPLNRFLQLGLKTGAEVHYFEFDHQGNKETYFSFPFQAIATIKCLVINKKWAIFNSFAGGININNWNRLPSYKKTGFLGTADISLAAPGLRNSIYYKIGFEYARQSGEYEFIPPDPPGPLKYEKVSLASHRQLAFASVGYSF